MSEYRYCEEKLCNIAYWAKDLNGRLVTLITFGLDELDLNGSRQEGTLPYAELNHGLGSGWQRRRDSLLNPTKNDYR